jgi:hypothetical protein
MTFLTRLLVVALHPLANASFAQTGDAARAAESRLPLPDAPLVQAPKGHRRAEISSGQAGITNECPKVASKTDQTLSATD